MVRNIGAVLAGLIVGMIVNFAIFMLNSYVLFPMPEGTDVNDAEQFSAYVATLPSQAFLVVMAAHLGQSFVGGWVAARLAASRVMVMAMIIGVLSLCGGIMMMMTVTGPTWMYIELPLYLVVAWLAGQMELKRRAKK